MSKRKPDCDQTRRLISDGIDQPLTPNAALCVQVHLTNCAECASFERVARGGTAGITALPSVQGNPQVRDQVMSAIYRGPDARPQGWRGWAKQGAQLAGAGIAFALVAVVLMAVIGSGGNGDGERGSGGGFGSDTATASPTAQMTGDTAAGGGKAEQVGECQPGQVSFETWVEANALEKRDATATATAAPSVILFGVTALKETGGAICHLDTEVTISLRDALGQLLDIEGNGQTVALSGLVPDDASGASFAWDNWCGANVDVSLRVEGAGGTSEEGPIATPACRDESMPSKLGQAEMAEAFPPGPTMFDACGSSFSILPGEELPSDIEAGAVVLWYGEGLSEECNNDGTLTLTIRDSDGALMDIESNPLELTLQPSSDDPNFGLVGIIWSNWCGVTDEATFELAATASGSGGSLSPLPNCTDPAQPSRLTITYDVPAGWLKFPPAVEALPPPVDLPDCDTGDLELLMKTDWSGDGLHIYPFALPSGDFCNASGELTVTVADADGNPLNITANAATVQIGGEALPMTGGTSFLWSNWCGGEVDAQIVVTFGTLATTLAVEALPDCADDTQPSTLTIVEEPVLEMSNVACVGQESAIVADDPNSAEATPFADAEVVECAVETQPGKEKEPESTPEP